MSLPKGGGAIRGLGESFSADEFSGTAGFSIPIPVSPCRGFEPALDLVYNSGQGNGAFGLGFSLSAPAISRATNKGTPRYDGGDRFVVDGGTYLSPVQGRERTEKLNIDGQSSTFEVTQFAPRRLSDFSLIEFWQEAGQPAAKESQTGRPPVTFWKVTGADHVISIFGRTQSARVADPEHPERVFRWLLEESYDPAGNHRLYHYKEENTVNVDTALAYEKHRLVGAQRYPSRVCYGNDRPIAGSILLGDHATDDIEWHFEIVFNYGEYGLPAQTKTPYTPIKDWACRPDPFSQYLPGYEVRTYRRCESVMLFHRFLELGEDPVLVSVLRLRYGRIEKRRWNNGHISQIVGVIETGYTREESGTYVDLSYPELKIGYTEFNPVGGEFAPLEAERGRLNGIDGGDYSLVDLYGQGIPGILYADGETVVYREPVFETNAASGAGQSAADTVSFSSASQLALNTGDMRYGDWQCPERFPIPRSVSGAELELTDRTGNGRLDLLHIQPGARLYWQANPDGSWTQARTFERYPITDPAPNQTELNATGAGLSDLFQIRNDRTFVYPSARAAGFDPAVTAEREPGMPSTLESSETTLLRFADLAGAGTPQFVKIENGRVRYWPSLGYGRFGRPVEMGQAPDFIQVAGSFRSDRLFLADVDGSGTADLLYVNAKTLYVFLNFNGNTFSDPIRIDLPATFDSLDQISFADVYGQGTACLVLSFPHGLPGADELAPRFLCYAFAGRRKPYLMNSLDNNLGAKTEIEYRSSVDYYLADQRAGLPWITSLPFPVQVVARVTAEDLLTGSSYTSRFAYHHGYYDGEEREFQGFGRVDKQDTEYFPQGQVEPEDPEYTAPSLSRTWYNVGCYEEYEALQEQYQKEYYRGDDAALPLPASVVDCPDEASRSQAYAALTGTQIHQEMYGLDDSEHDAVPYAVQCESYTVTMRQPVQANAYGIFFVQARESQSYTYDRDPRDPRVEQSFTLLVDEFGNTELETAVAYPRRGVAPEGQHAVERETLAQQYRLNVQCTNTGYYNHAGGEDYLLGVPLWSRSYHLPQIKAGARGFTFDEILEKISAALATVSDESPGSDAAVLLGWSRSTFARVDPAGQTRPLKVGQVSLPVLPYQVQSAVEEQARLDALYDGALNATELAAKLDEGFFAYEKENGYRWNYGLTENYNGAEDFYLPSRTIAPATLTNNKDGQSVTTYQYDAYRLILTGVEDALGNRTRAEDIDYQTLQPRRLINANETSSEALYDPLGQVVYTSVYGYEDGQPVGFDPVRQAPSEGPADAAAVIADPEKYLGRMQSYFYYDFFAYVDRRQPVGALSLTAVDYPDAAKTARLSELSPIEIAVTYGDGLGRALQTKARVEPGPALLYNEDDGTLTEAHADSRWLTTGRTFYNNKGDPVKQYEPYFIDTPACVTNAALDTQGYSSTLYYDPIGRLIKTLTPQGFIERSEYSPWHTTAYDANDSIKESPYYRDNIENASGKGEAAGETGGPYYDPDLSEAGKDNLRYVAKYFADTPVTNLSDNLGNTIVLRRINQYPSDLNAPLAEDSEIVREELADYMEYDSTGRQVRSSDPRLSEKDIYNFEMAYVMAGESPLKTISVDAGTSWILPNALGSPVFSYDSRGVAMTTEYDLLQRPIASHAKKTQPTGASMSSDDPLVIDQVVGRMIYGDSPDSGAPAKHNLVGQAYQAFDSAGMVTRSSYSIGGQPLSGERRFFKDYKTQGNWDDFGAVARARLLQSEAYMNHAAFDALGRVIESRDSDGNLSFPEYHIGGALNKLVVTTADDSKTTQYVNGISYNAMGQRLKMQAGNGMTTDYFYDPRTHATIRTRTNNAKGRTLQEVAYEYDPVGNVFRKEILSEEQVFYNQELVTPVSAYMFDALYQLIQATGREKIGTGQEKNRDPDLPVTPNIPHENDLKALRKYTERYAYDRGGNRTHTEHRAFGRQWTRDMIVSNGSNRAVSSRINGDEKNRAPTPEQVDDFFDAHGNQVQLRTAHPLAWDYANQLQSVTIVERQLGADQGDLPTGKDEHRVGTDDQKVGKDDREYYVYDGGGQRVRKINETYGFGGKTVSVRETLYLGNIEIRRKSRGADPESASVQNEYHSLRINDGESGVATRDLWTVGDPPGEFQNPTNIYHLQDNLNSYTTQVDDAGKIIAREEYAPFGESTLFEGVGGADQLTHYRYSGQERDNATGFYYYGARYYATWLGRWLSPDPAGTIDGPNLYAFVGNNPVTMVDVGGMVKKRKNKPQGNVESDSESEPKLLKKVKKNSEEPIKKQKQKQEDESESVIEEEEKEKSPYIDEYTDEQFEKLIEPTTQKKEPKKSNAGNGGYEKNKMTVPEYIVEASDIMITQMSYGGTNKDVVKEEMFKTYFEDIEFKFTGTSGNISRMSIWSNNELKGKSPIGYSSKASDYGTTVAQDRVRAVMKKLYIGQDILKPDLHSEADNIYHFLFVKNWGEDKFKNEEKPINIYTISKNLKTCKSCKMLYAAFLGYLGAPVNSSVHVLSPKGYGGMGGEPYLQPGTEIINNLALYKIHSYFRDYQN